MSLEYYETNISWVGDQNKEQYADNAESIKNNDVKNNDESIKTDEVEVVASNKRHTLPKVDCHGFVVSHQLHSKVSSLPNPAITGEIGKRRELKWLEMIHNWDIMMRRKPSKIRERCQKGIPKSVRSLAWQHLSGSVKLRENNMDLFEKLTQSNNTEWGDVIRKDIPRTFRHHCMFHESGSQGQDNLYNVLLAYSQYDKAVGYNQALAPVAAVLLMHMPPDETFWVLVSICKYYLPGYYGEKMEAMRLDGLIFDNLLNSLLPSVAKQLSNNNIDPLMYIVEWMVCIFARCLPFQTVLRIWDMFFCEGVKILFKVGIAILKLVFPTLDDLIEKDDFLITQTLNNLPKERIVETVLIPEALNVNISDKDFEKAHRKILKQYPELSVIRFAGGIHLDQ